MFTQIGERGEQQEHWRWVLDTGATNHMTGSKSVFCELDSGIRGMVKFSDGSVVEIEGHDTILFVDKGGKHHKLTAAEKAHVAQSEEDEPALFMVTASILPDVPNSNSKSTEVIDDGITAPVSVEPEEELQLCITKDRLGSQFN